ncbi:MAG: glycoside hydrolase family 78 protein [Prevotellaceae bacterium]|jgi:alpha-L-rhamnosidase|nr:glycoside hydrolase family 78 protein [Prevotellaceae bacterium]
MYKKTNFFIIFFAFACSLFAQAQVQPVKLRCEYLVNPLGIDVYNPRLSWQLQDERYGAVQQAYRIIVGTNSSDVSAGNGTVWDKSAQSDDMLVTYSGKPLTPFTKYFWRVEIKDKDNIVKTSEVASFETGIMDMSNWKGYWISDEHAGNNDALRIKPAPYFRKEFQPAKAIKSARAYIAVAGLYELYINGKRIGDHRLDPMYTHFDRRNLYVTYDVTQELQTGKNAIGVLLGNGWYNLQSIAVWFFDRAPWRERPAFCMDLRITYDDGSVETIRSERDWKTNLSPIIFNSIYTAEHYDARLEQPGWNTVGFDDSKWKNTVYRLAPSLNIVSQQLHPIRNVEQIPVKNFKKISNQHYLFDLGRNISGVSQLRVKGDAGAEIRLVHSEILRADDKVDIRNIAEHYRPVDDSDPFATDIFILSGKDEEEEFMPRFNYKGFQYVEVTSDKPIELTANSLTGWFMHSDLPPVGHVETSNPTINKIWFAANSSYLANMFGYPTDCPHREKNGWTGDANYAVDLGLFNFDGVTVYEKWMADHQDEQQPNGLLPNIIPTSGWGLDWATGPDWTGSVAIVPWAVYEFYGDSRLLENMYDNIKRYVERVADLSPDGLCNLGLGDWVPVKAQTPQKYTTTVYYYRVVSILAKAAKLFEKTEDYVKYSALAEKIKSAFNKEYLNRETAIYGSGYQTEMSAALLWGLVPDELHEKIVANLAKRVVEIDSSHLNVGLLGSKAIFHALSENGYADLAYTVAAQETYPSLGHWIVKDKATTLYEAWSAIGEARESSLNHIMFGEVNAWFYKALGGIRINPEQPGFKQFSLRPHFVKGLNFANVSYDSPRGKIVSHWERKNKKTIRYHVIVPPNCSASLSLPEGYKLKKTQLDSGEKVDLQLLENGEYRLVAGNYRMEIDK